MTLAFTISAYRMHSFVRLGVAQLRRLAPQSPILISDDPGIESEHIRAVADEFGCTYRCPTKRRGHFAGDFQSLVNALAFAEAARCDVGVKVSQRFIFRKPEAISVIQKSFDDPNIAVVTPGQPATKSGNVHSGGFARFTTLSDIVAIRVGAMTPDDLLQMYRGRLVRERNVPWASFIECAVDDLHHSRFPGRTIKLAEITNPTEDPIYLRRYQATEHQYRDLAMSHGFNGMFPTGEWGQIEGKNYMCRPIVV
jgi:hypothetical protein